MRALSLTARTAAMAQTTSCIDATTVKRLSGAAKTSFLKHCETHPDGRMSTVTSADGSTFRSATEEENGIGNSMALS